MPSFAFPPAGPLGLRSPPSSVLCSATTATRPSQASCDSSPLRPDTSLLPPVCVPSPPECGSFTHRKPADERQVLFLHRQPLSGCSFLWSQMALPSFRVSCRGMPRSSTTTGGLMARLTPSPCCLPQRKRASAPVTSAFFEAQYWACFLVPSSFRFPLPGLPVAFTSDLLARL